MNIYQRLKQDIGLAITSIINDLESINNKKLNNNKIPIILEYSKDINSYDISTNVAMLMAKIINHNSIILANLFKNKLSQYSYITNIVIAEPGFINFSILKQEWLNYLATILDGSYREEYSNLGSNKKVNIEYVSANPTGPLHIGHARAAVYGDVLATLLQFTGYKVTREYYVNDTGVQIDNLAKSVYLRYKQAITGQEVDISKGLYPGKYLVPIGVKLATEYKNNLLSLSEPEYLNIIKDVAVNDLLQSIKEDLALIGVQHDIFFSEKKLHDNNAISRVIDLLSAKQLIYTGKLLPPKGQNNNNWQPRSQLLFKSTIFGDDQDRPLQKEDGSWSYFASDIAYAENKIKRGFNYVIFILGADHIGYVNRIRAIIQALDYKKEINLDIKICQLVKLIENGTTVKMSKRSGSFTTIRDVYETVGKDVIRFFMLTRKNNTVLDFDLIKLQEQSRDNPVFYVQYAYVRAGSVLKNAKNNANKAYEIFSANKSDFNLLSTKEELNLIKKLAVWPHIIEGAVKHFEPHSIALYLQKLAVEFHALWSLKKCDLDYRFIVTNDNNLTAARLALAVAVREIIREGLKIIGITCVEVM
ncbi:arginine--tRNA ligase [Orientia chuto str. Dubai]|uniref:Arginine--tRNA ligase n=1 Tax=Orientia chuto str. Dubai TaxID=1359168 RepID=A0A0F3MMH1_9RICK|nr:arginine--tRNA ligase [Candidatus Orientia mediorientalis]KJV56642.1 arginine--tRNA ligase [Orientia chuto str. Dubai]